jgi:xanthine dehydrogenase YagT iron-sulfur-binding subunit
MNPCHFSDARRGFLKKTASLAALYLTPSILVNAVAAEIIIPAPIPKEKLHLSINGKVFDLEIDARTTLLNLLREQIGYTGTKKGCEMGQCGACTIHINGKRTKSCMQLALNHQNNQITTIEGLSKGDDLHPMQKAFLKHDAFQCGYCTSGQIMSAVACVREGQTKNRDMIKSYMDTNICRCGAYQNIVDAIEEVAKSGTKI